MKRSACLRKAPDTARASVLVFKPKRCACCKEMFTPARSMQLVCSGTCGIAYAQAQTAKKSRRDQRAEKAADRERRDKLKPRSAWLKEVQVAFNAWVRKRDEKAGLPCISCCRHHTGSYDAGHYLTVGARPELRFEPLNTWRQCVPCNQHLHGNLVLYRLELVRRIGAEKVAWLEGPHEPKHYSIDDLKALKAHYRGLARELDAA